ncbi:MAG TPA: hypothetical protein DD412_03560 [Holosporales bacterium]|nr:hypothetical protein [Holosporales bacterium]
MAEIVYSAQMLDFDWRTLELEKRNTRSCDHLGCDQEGLFPAPKNVQNLTSRYYFCLEHVKAYNDQWNYIDQIRSTGGSADTDDTQQHHPFKRHGKPFSHFFHQSPNDPLGMLGEDEEDNYTPPPTQKVFSPKTKEGRAFVALELSWPFTETDLKQAYKTLAKRYHPDLNQEDSSAIEKFREIKESYELLKVLL